MVTTLGIVIILGLASSALFKKMRLPGLIGMLATGILIGPYVLNIMDDHLLVVSSDFRKIALIVILLRAGLGVSRSALHKVGRPALLMSFLPGVFEGLAIAGACVWLLDWPFVVGGVLGFIIAAVSPAVVVPKMIQYAQEGRGAHKGIPTLILASASIDDVFAITLFSAFVGLYSGSHVNIGVEIAKIPVAILLGVGLGVFTGFLLLWLFRRYPMRDTHKALYLLAVATLITGLEALLKNQIEIAGLIGVMAIGFIILEKDSALGKRLSNKFGKIWIFAELLLFVLVGAEVNIHVVLDSGLIGLAIIAIGLVARSIGVFIATTGSGFTFKERVFCVVAYLPKATVQAAIGGVPLALNMPQGELILAIAVLSIVVTAPIGAALIHVLGERWLEIEV
ncbi:cation:proton antiporter [Fusibacter sp. JL298sf-3]